MIYIFSLNLQTSHCSTYYDYQTTYGRKSRIAVFYSLILSQWAWFSMYQQQKTIIPLVFFCVSITFRISCFMCDGYRLHHSQYWTRIHYDTIEDGQNKTTHRLFYNYSHFSLVRSCLSGSATLHPTCQSRLDH